MPIFKKGDANMASNYRPISLLSVVGKLFERIIHKNIHNFLLDNDLFYKYQSGFLPNNSTVYQLLEIYHSIVTGMEDKTNTCFIFCDVSKAFDRVWHKGLIVKLEAHGIKGSLLQFLSNYLSDRKQSVFVNSSMSSFKTTNAGVPQGSVLGPLMFLLYVNDIADNLLNISRLFADDTSVSSSSNDTQEIKRTLERDMEKVLDWSNKWKVSFNPSKTELLFIGNCPDDFEIIFNNTPIKPIDSHKHLGLTFSSNAKWSLHIDNICNSALRRINFLKKLKYKLTRCTLNKIYCTFILPILEYGCEVWGGCSKGDEEKLEKVQLEAARLVTGLPLFTSKCYLYSETGWEKLCDRRERRKLTLFHKIFHNNTPEYLSDIITPYKRNNVYNLRSDADFVPPNFRLLTTNRSFFPSTIRSWDTLEQDLRHCPSFTYFKSTLKSRRDVHITPLYLLVGDRKWNILQTRLRCHASALNSDLYRVNLTDSPFCQCGNMNEDAHHFLFECILYTNHRVKLYNKVMNYQPITTDKLLSGDPV